jgi:hypothetical protein
MPNENRRGDNPHDGSTDDERTDDSCGCGNGLECFEHYEIRERNDSPTAHTDGGLSRIPHTPALGDVYVIDNSAYEVACFADSGSTVVFEPIARPTSEVVMPLDTVRESEAASYIK